MPTSLMEVGGGVFAFAKNPIKQNIMTRIFFTYRLKVINVCRFILTRKLKVSFEVDDSITFDQW